MGAIINCCSKTDPKKKESVSDNEYDDSDSPSDYAQDHQVDLYLLDDTQTDYTVQQEIIQITKGEIACDNLGDLIICKVRKSPSEHACYYRPSLRLSSKLESDEYIVDPKYEYAQHDSYSIYTNVPITLAYVNCHSYGDIKWKDYKTNLNENVYKLINDNIKREISKDTKCVSVFRLKAKYAYMVAYYLRNAYLNHELTRPLHQSVTILVSAYFGGTLGAGDNIDLTKQLSIFAPKHIKRKCRIMDIHYVPSEIIYVVY